MTAERPIIVPPRFVDLFDLLLVDYECNHEFRDKQDSDIPEWVAEARRLRSEARLQRTMDKVRKEITSAHFE